MSMMMVSKMRFVIESMLVLTASLIVSGDKIVPKTQAGKLANKIIVFCLSPVSDIHVHLLSFFPKKVT